MEGHFQGDVCVQLPFFPSVQPLLGQSLTFLALTVPGPGSLPPSPNCLVTWEFPNSSAETRWNCKDCPCLRGDRGIVTEIHTASFHFPYELQPGVPHSSASLSEAACPSESTQKLVSPGPKRVCPSASPYLLTGTKLPLSFLVLVSCLVSTFCPSHSPALCARGVWWGSLVSSKWLQEAS